MQADSKMENTSSILPRRRDVGSARRHDAVSLSTQARQADVVRSSSARADLFPAIRKGVFPGLSAWLRRNARSLARPAHDEVLQEHEELVRIRDEEESQAHAPNGARASRGVGTTSSTPRSTSRESPGSRAPTWRVRARQTSRSGPSRMNWNSGSFTSAAGDLGQVQRDAKERARAVVFRSGLA